MRKTRQRSYSVDEKAGTVSLRFRVPARWRDLSQEQLRYVLLMLSRHGSSVETKTYLLFRFAGIEPLKKIRGAWRCRARLDGRTRVFDFPDGQILEFTKVFDYIDTYEGMDCRLDAVCGLAAVDPLLHGVSFHDYMQAEKYYQKWQAEKKDEWLDYVALYLYADGNGLHAGQEKTVADDVGRSQRIVCTVGEMTLQPEERLGTMMWYAHVKDVFSRAFPHFFKKVEPSEGKERAPSEYIRQYDIQLRALTGGDVTKEQVVLSLDCWRALTELDAKARDAEEYDRIMKSNRH